MATPLDVQILPLHPQLGKSLPMPQQMSAGAAGFDLAAALDAPVRLAPGQWQLVPCGFSMAMPHGYEAQVRPRSGLAYKHGISCLNTPGTIDADYRGEVKVLLVNFGAEPFEITPGMRIAQLVFAALPQVAVRVVDALGVSERGAGGFGSTGKGGAPAANG